MFLCSPYFVALWAVIMVGFAIGLEYISMGVVGFIFLWVCPKCDLMHGDPPEGPPGFPLGIYHTAIGILLCALTLNIVFIAGILAGILGMIITAHQKELKKLKN